MEDQKKKNHRRTSSSASNSSNSQHHQERDFQCWTSLRAIFGMVVPCCGAGNGGPNTIATNTNKLLNNMSMMGNPQSGSLASSIVTGTIFGQRRGKVNFCVQEDPAGPPLLLLEFAIPTHLLVKEMQSGLLRITLECDKRTSVAIDPLYLDDSLSPSSSSLFSEPVWSLYCNGRKVGFAIKKMAKSDADPAIANFMTLMQSVTTGAGVIPCRTNSYKHGLVQANKDSIVGSLVDPKLGTPRKEGIDDVNADEGDATINDKQELHGLNGTKDSVHNSMIDVLGMEKSSKEEDELIYMRAKYEKVVGSQDSAAFHMINPDGSQCQELSIFLTRS